MEITNQAAVKCADSRFCKAKVSIITKFKRGSDKAFPRLKFPKEKPYTIWSIKSNWHVNRQETKMSVHIIKPMNALI